jgi:uridine kinase
MGKRRQFLIAIVGGSGAGKTWLAFRLESALARGALRLSLDDFYRDLSSISIAERSQVNFDDPAAIDWALLQTVLDRLDEGKAATAPRYDFTTHTRKAGTVEVGPSECVLLEGLWVLHPPWLRRRVQFSVYLDRPAEERLRYRIERDTSERERTEASVRRQFEEHVQPMHARFVEPQRAWASCCMASPVDAATVKKVEDEVRALLARGQPASRLPSPSYGSPP